jgi:hypothetical protein
MRTSTQRRFELLIPITASLNRRNGARVCVSEERLSIRVEPNNSFRGCFQHARSDLSEAVTVCGEPKDCLTWPKNFPR